MSVQRYDRNFRRATHPHRGPPGAGPARDVDLKIFFPVQAVVISPVDKSCEQCEGKKLSAMGVAGELQVDTHGFGEAHAGIRVPIGAVLLAASVGMLRVDIRGGVVQENAGLLGVIYGGVCQEIANIV